MERNIVVGYSVSYKDIRPEVSRVSITGIPVKFEPQHQS